MYIRIGNNIKFNIDLSTLNVDSIDNVVYAKGRFIAIDCFYHEPSHSCCNPQFYNSEYTIHDCNTLSYNTFPANVGITHKCTHDHGFRVYEDYSSPVRTDSTNSKIILIFPKEHQRLFGRYKVELEYVVKSDPGNVIKKQYGTLFCLTKTIDSVQSYVEVSFTEKEDDTTPPDNPTPSTNYIYYTSLSVSETLSYKGDLSLIKSELTSHDLNTIIANNAHVAVSGNNKRILFISNISNLSFSYSGFLFPVSRTKIENEYLYVSAEEYNELLLYISIERKNINYSSLDFELIVENEGAPTEKQNMIISDGLLESNGEIQNNVLVLNSKILNNSII